MTMIPQDDELPEDPVDMLAYLYESEDTPHDFSSALRFVADRTGIDPAELTDRYQARRSEEK